MRNRTSAAGCIVELSGPIEDGMWDYNVLPLGGARLPEARVQRIAHIDRHGFDAHRFEMSSLSGTYTETGAHLIPGARTLDEIELCELMAPAKVLRVPDLPEEAVIQPAQLEAHAPALEPGDALIIDTGWGSQWGRPGYVREAPAFSVQTLPWLLEQPISLLAVDTPVIECSAERCSSSGSDHGAVLKPLFEKGILLVAPLVNLEKLDGTSTGTLMSWPLLVPGACSAPSRVGFVPDPHPPAPRTTT